MAIRNDFTAGEVLAAADLNDTFADKVSNPLVVVSDTLRPQIEGYRARAGVTAVQDTDPLFFLQARGYDGTSYVSAGRIEFQVDGAVTTGTVPMMIRFLIGSSLAARIGNDFCFYLTRNAASEAPASYKTAPTSSTGQARLFTNSTTNSGTLGMESLANSTSTRHHIAFSNGNGVVGSISTNASATAYNTSSDYRLKQDAEPIGDALTRLQELNPIRFAWKSDPSYKVDGFLAHEAQQVVPECVTGEKDGLDENGQPTYQGIDQSKLVPLLVAAVQELAAEVAALKAAQK
jgi:hypothetical protein